MILKTHKDLDLYTNIKSEKIFELSNLVSDLMRMPVQPNKAIVGANAFAHESGIHQAGMLKNAETFEIMTPESVGLTQSRLVLGKHSGRHALKKRLEELGLRVGRRVEMIQPGTPCIVRLEGAKLCVRHGADCHILVRPGAAA